MNNRLYAKQRDKKALEYIEMLGALTTPQIKELCFPKSMRKAQQRLKVLSPKLNRVRPSIDSPYIYFYDKPVHSISEYKSSIYEDLDKVINS